MAEDRKKVILLRSYSGLNTGEAGTYSAQKARELVSAGVAYYADGIDRKYEVEDLIAQEEERLLNANSQIESATIARNAIAARIEKYKAELNAMKGEQAPVPVDVNNEESGPLAYTVIDGLEKAYPVQQMVELIQVGHINESDVLWPDGFEYQEQQAPASGGVVNVSISYGALSLNDLRNECKGRGIEFTQRTSKGDLVSALEEWDKQNA